jgi:hypothetical protein
MSLLTALTTWSGDFGGIDAHFVVKCESSADVSLFLMLFSHVNISKFDIIMDFGFFAFPVFLLWCWRISLLSL